MKTLKLFVLAVVLASATGCVDEESFKHIYEMNVTRVNPDLQEVQVAGPGETCGLVQGCREFTATSWYGGFSVRGVIICPNAFSSSCYLRLVHRIGAETTD